MISPADRLRIAVALAVLKHKPPSQSFASYVMDLRATFHPPGPSPPTSDGSWRTHALQMESECALLKAQLDAERIKNVGLKESNTAATTSSQVTVMSSQPTSDPQGPLSNTGKKKGKKKKQVINSSPLRSAPAEGLAPEPVTLNLQSVLEGLRPQELSTLRLDTPNSPLITLDAFFQVTSLCAAMDGTEGLLVGAASRVLETISSELCLILNSSVVIPRPCAVLEVFTKLLQEIVLKTLRLVAANSSGLHSAIASSEDLDALLGVVMKRIFLPSICSLLPLSERYLQALLKGTMDVENEAPVDIRYGVLSLLRTLAACLFSRTSLPSDNNAKPPSVPGTTNALLSLASLRMSLILETIKELHRTLHSGGGNKARYYGRGWERPSPPGLSPSARDSPIGSDHHDGPNSAHPHKRRNGDERDLSVKKLAIKDALWFFCTLLHALSDPRFPAGAHVILASSLQAQAADATPSKDSTETHTSPNAYDKGLEHMRLAIKDALLNLVVDCQRRRANKDSPRSTENKETGGAMEGTANADDANHFTATGRGHPGEEGAKEFARDADAVNGLEDGALIDESGYGMVLGVVEQLLMDTA